MIVSHQLAFLQNSVQHAIVDQVSNSSVAIKKRHEPECSLLPIHGHLHIYQNAYRSRLVEALSNAYPKLKLLLGDNLFSDLSHTYIGLWPSRNRNIRWYGMHMPQFLRQRLPQHPVASELALFEWALGTAFDSADTSVFSMEDLAITPPQLWTNSNFILHSSVQFYKLHENTIETWKALDQDLIPEIKTSEECYWLIWRQDLNPHFRSLDEVESKIFCDCHNGYSFSQICENLATSYEAEFIQNKMAQWLADSLNGQLITGIRPSQSELHPSTNISL